MAMVECPHNNIPGYCSTCDDEMVAARMNSPKGRAAELEFAANICVREGLIDAARQLRDRARNQ